MPRRATSALARSSVAIVLAASVWGADSAPPLVIQLRVATGGGAIYALGSKATRGVSIQVSDESGKPVDGASVSFQLPAKGPSGTFSSGSLTEIVTTKADGAANIWGMQWNKIPGPFEIRVTASKGKATAGIIVPQTLAQEAHSGGEGTFTASHHRRNKWLIIGIAAGGAVAGLAAMGTTSKSAPAAAPVQTPVQIGNPTIIVGKP